MLEQILEVIRPSIQSAPYVHKFGGLVKTVSKKETDDKGKTVTLKFPVNCAVSHEECWYQNRYLDLVPDDRYSSIFYFEPFSSFKETDTQRIAKARFSTYRGQVRLVGWLNLAKMGIEDCFGSSRIAHSLVQYINKRFRNLDSPFKLKRLSFRMIEEESRDKNPFDKYTYNEFKQFLLYPFDYVSLIIEVEAFGNAKCFAEADVGDPLDCFGGPVFAGNNANYVPCGGVDITLTHDFGQVMAGLNPIPGDVELLWFLDEGDGFLQVGTGPNTDANKSGTYKLLAKWGTNCEAEDTINVTL